MNSNPHQITNHYEDVHLVSLASWRQANQIFPRDRRGPYVVLQEGYAPEDSQKHDDEFILGRSGKWLPLGLFYRMPVPERRDEFVFGTASEVMRMMSHLPAGVEMFDRSKLGEASQETRGPDPMMSAIEAGMHGGSAEEPAPSHAGPGFLARLFLLLHRAWISFTRLLRHKERA